MLVGKKGKDLGPKPLWGMVLEFMEGQIWGNFFCYIFFRSQISVLYTYNEQMKHEMENLTKKV